MSYRVPRGDVQPLVKQAVGTALSYIPIIGPVLSNFAGPIAEVISGIGTDQAQLFRDWEAAYLKMSPILRTRFARPVDVARERNQARAILGAVITRMKRSKRP